MSPIKYSCKKCKKEFIRIDDVENHLEEIHSIFNQADINKQFLIHFPPYPKGV